MKKSTVVLKEVVPSYVPKEIEITRVTFDDDDVAYLHPSGNQLNVVDLDMNFIIGCWVDQFRCMVHLMDDDNDDHVEYRTNLDGMLQAFAREMDEIFEAVYSNIGTIKCHQVGYREIGCRDRRVVGAELIPVQEGSAA